jgi:hypothetical protein
VLRLVLLTALRIVRHRVWRLMSAFSSWFVSRHHLLDSPHAAGPVAVSARADRVVATRAARVLNDFMGHLNAARACLAIWTRQTDNPTIQRTARYGLQIALGTIALTMRKLEDFNDKELPRLIRDRAQRPAAAKWLRQESKARHLRAIANTWIAHYTDETGQILSAVAVHRLIERGGWATEEELMAWVDPVIGQVEVVRDAIMAQHQITGLDEE